MTTLVIPNLFAQVSILANKENWDFNDICMIFGDQDFPENTHKCGFSPEMIKRLLFEVGFRNIIIGEHPQCKTDMIIEASKMQEPEPGNEFEREYFEGGPYDFYLDFGVHWKTVHILMELEPESVLDVGGARGFIVKHLEEQGVPAHCMDISRWAYANRVTNSFTVWDMRNIPWPFKDNEFDLSISIATLEHIDEEYIPGVLREFARVSKRGWHGISFETEEWDVDYTHKLFKPKEWWEEQFKIYAPNHPVNILSKEETEMEGDDWRQYIPSDPKDKIKLNLGSFLDMYFHGWINVDIQNLRAAANQLGTRFRQFDVTKKIREEDNTVDCIITSHLIEHLNKAQGKKLVEEIYRVLKPGAVARIGTPDIKKIARKYLDGTIEDFALFNIGVKKGQDALSFWNLLTEGHQIAYDAKSLISLLEEAGFESVKECRFNETRSDIIRTETYDLHPEISIYVEGFKPVEEISNE